MTMQKVILLVDDSPEQNELLKLSLQAVGVENPIHLVASGEEALDYLKGEGKYSDREKFPFPKVMFLDLALPGIDGWDVLKWIQSQPMLDPTLAIFVVTGTVSVHRLREAYDLGADSFLMKPLRQEEIIGLIRYWPAVWVLKDQFSALPDASRQGVRSSSET